MARTDHYQIAEPQTLRELVHQNTVPWRLVPSVGLGARRLHHGFVAP